MAKKDKVLLLSIGILLVLAIIVGASYALWRGTHEQTDANIVYTSCFEIEFSEITSGLDVANVFPLEEEEGKKTDAYVFTIKNICDVSAEYSVAVEVLNTTTLSKNLLRVMLDNNSSTILTNNEIAETTINNATNSYVIFEGILSASSEVNHEYRQWIDYSASYNDSYNKVIETKVVVNSIASMTKELSEGIISINTPEQFLKIGTDEILAIGGSYYKFSSDSEYIVEKDLSIDYDGIWSPNINSDGKIITNDKVVTIKNINDNSVRYFQNQLFVTKDNAIEDGLVLHYDSLNNTGSGYSNSASVWKDLKGNNNGNLQGGTTWNGNSLKFDGVNGKVSFNGAITANYSIIITVKPELTGIHPRLFSEITFPTLYLHSNNAYKLAFYGTGNDKVFDPTLVPSTVDPNYIVITYDTSVILLYVNGVEVGSMTASNRALSTSIAYIGGRAANDRQYKGLVYDFMVYNRTLSGDEVKNSYITNQFKYPN